MAFIVPPVIVAVPSVKVVADTLVRPEIVLFKVIVIVSVADTVALIFESPAKVNTSPELICCTVDEESLIVKAVVTAELTSLIAATIEDVSVVLRLAKSPTSVPKELKVVLRVSKVSVVATLLIAILLYYFL